ncbi:ATP-binding cassette domain-containing protein [Anaerobacillus sp. HL2]|nr:ATP-binding cassette domain-containing protein [Anaerobacillus sp. HL2]
MKEPRREKALQNINLSLDAGDFITVIGSNGAGKSTLMNTTSGSLFPDVGEVFIDEKNVTHIPEYKRALVLLVGSSKIQWQGLHQI